MNKFFLRMHGDDIVAAFPLPQRLSKDAALELAAYLILLADSGNTGPESKLAAWISEACGDK